ncbi:MAG: RidA family protein [Acidobacteriaceae bacterium]|nr:RidA family protein [Acidobacteriaceae bacterium]
MNIDARLKALGIELAQAPKPAANYLLAKQMGGLCFLAGAISLHGDVVITGRMGENRSVEEGYSAARASGLRALAMLASELGSLERVASVVSVTGFVNATPEFDKLAGVMDGFSDLMVDVFGEAGKHVRTAVGASSLPRNALIEVQMVVATNPAGS